MHTVKVGSHRRPIALAGYKTYDVRRMRQCCRRRNVAERGIGWLKLCRRVGIRGEKLAVHFLGKVKLAMIQRTLRVMGQP